ncbi:hypothetical protein QVD17_03158 [Tagetes erecta]|uniref:Uncharacterized protein n=1 Tax=Tagetes erecta TaxID=13708 RepID=A0AAD8LF82_TARER|nr:hypothetical protein QVD17_03158 [Tagetes erecta]
MGASTKEKGVLKLVHPGRHVEYYRKSIIAGEIMRKNPRHSVTRPDFFKNPGVVVHPESVMVPGQVFYIVPNTTVHSLVKNKSQQLGQSLTESPNTSDYKHVSKRTSTCRLWAGVTPMYPFHRKQEGPSSCVNSLPKDEETTLDDGLTFQARDYYVNGYTPHNRLSKTIDYTRSHTRQVNIYNNKQEKNLKSCMKKEGVSRTSPNLRVTFDFSTMIKY